MVVEFIYGQLYIEFEICFKQESVNKTKNIRFKICSTKPESRLFYLMNTNPVIDITSVRPMVHNFIDIRYVFFF